jgi:hypothetical protein
MTILRRRYRQILGPCGHFAKFADGLCRYFDVRLHFDTHLIWQATKRKLKRRDASGFILHKASPVCWVVDGGRLICRRLPLLEQQTCVDLLLRTAQRARP